MKAVNKEERISLAPEGQSVSSMSSGSVKSNYFDSSPTFTPTDTGTFVAHRVSQTDAYIEVDKKTTERQQKIGSSEIFFDELDSPAIPRDRLAITYTESFLKLKTAKFVAKLQPLLTEWIGSIGDPAELTSVKSIFNLIEENSRYFEAKPNNRLVLGTIQNFFLKWSKLEKKQISQFGELLHWFKEGDIADNKVRSFSQEVFLLLQRSKSENAKEKEEE